MAADLMANRSQLPLYALVWGALKATWIVFANEEFQLGETNKCKTKFIHWNREVIQDINVIL